MIAVLTKVLCFLQANILYTAGVGNHEKFYNFSSYLTRFRNPAPW